MRGSRPECLAIKKKYAQKKYVFLFCWIVIFKVHIILATPTRRLSPLATACTAGFLRSLSAEVIYSGIALCDDGLTKAGRMTKKGTFALKRDGSLKTLYVLHHNVFHFLMDMHVSK